MTTTNPGGGGEPINWTGEDDPITAAVRHAGQTLTNAAERGFQIAYMMQIMRTQRVQDDLAALGVSHAQVPLEDTHAVALNDAITPGDVVLVPDHNRAARVVTTHPDGRITVSLDDHLDLEPGQYQVLANPTVETRQPAASGQRSPEHETDQILRPGDRVRAHDRGNIGLVISVDDDTALVRFTNIERGTSADVPLPVTSLDRLPPQHPARSSGLLRPDGRPDPERINRARTHRQPPTRPSTWNRNPKRGPRRPPKPPTP